MKYLIFFVFCGFALASEHTFDINQEFLDGYNKFASDVYTELRQTKPEDFVVSPFSVDILLALTEFGSQGETSKQLIKGLSLPENKKDVFEAFSVITPKLNADDKYTLTSANKLYVKEGKKLLETFTKQAVNVFNAEVQSIDFTNKETAAHKINAWIRQKTHNKIKNLISKDVIDTDTCLILLNALHFHGRWVNKFNSSHTKADDFYVNSGIKKTVPLMENKHEYNFYESQELGAKFLELPYVGKDVTLTIVLPNDKDGLETLENSIHKLLVTPQYTRERVHVKLPKFNIETRTEFNNILKNLGIVKPFEDTAEFYKITGDALKISQVVQKACIEVEEEGTTATAAAAVYATYVRSGIIEGETKQFIANHPFTFFLKFRSIVLFIGHYTGK